MDTEEIINDIKQTKDLSKSRIKTYKRVFKQYEKLHNMTMYELIVEADKEEEERVPLKRRRIKKKNNRL